MEVCDIAPQKIEFETISIILIGIHTNLKTTTYHWIYWCRRLLSFGSKLCLCLVTSIRGRYNWVSSHIFLLLGWQLSVLVSSLFFWLRSFQKFLYYLCFSFEDINHRFGFIFDIYLIYIWFGVGNDGLRFPLSVCIRDGLVIVDTFV